MGTASAPGALPRPRRQQGRAPSDRLRWRTLRRLDQRMEWPMALLGVVWLALFIADVTRGLNPLLAGLSTAIWILFIVEFAVRFLLAPDRAAYLRHRWLTALSLLVPALRIGRLFQVTRALRAARAARGVRLVRAVTSLNRGMTALGDTMRRRGVTYVILLTIAVTLGGAAGMYVLEPHGAAGEDAFRSYGDALWWTAMIMTTMGSAYWPRTPEGRILGFLLSLFAIGVFGYITATLASFFVDRNAATTEGGVAASADVRALRREIAALRRDLNQRAREA